MKSMIAILLLLSTSGLAAAESSQDKGLAISTEADRRDAGWSDSRADMTMTLRNRDGQTSTRILEILSMESQNDGDKMLAIFDEPRDIKGTAVLTWSHALTPDHQWIFLPSVKRVKRIASNNKSGPFMGSEFAYEDLASQEVAKYDHVYLRDEACGDLTCFVVERIPQYEYSGYSKQLAWIDSAFYRTQKIAYFDRREAPIKTLVFKDYEQYLGEFWRARNMFMDNHQTGKTTELVWENYRFNKGLTEADFDKNALKRFR